MGAGTAAMIEDGGIGAAGIFQGVGEDSAVRAFGAAKKRSQAMTLSVTKLPFTTIRNAPTCQANSTSQAEFIWPRRSSDAPPN